MQKKTRTPAKRPLKRSMAGQQGAVKALLSQVKGRNPAAALTIRRLEAQLRDARLRIAELKASAETDFLLDILNRRGFMRELTRALAFIARYGATGALIVLDVDRLKPINDAFGHAAGDAVLKAVVAVLRRYVRASDVIGRLGGDEFVLLLWNVDEATARTKAQMLEAAIDQLTFVFRDISVSAGASAGVTLLGPASDGDAALAEADKAMYARKTARRAKV